MTGRHAAVVVLGIAGVLAACSSDGSDSGAPPTCGGATPIECRSPEGVLQGCCPAAHPVCTLDGKSCIDFGSGGSANGSGSGGSAGSDRGGNAGASGIGGFGGTGGTVATGGTGAGGQAGAAGATGGTGASCNDTDEPNDTEATAKNLGAIDDCDGSGTSVNAVLDGKQDVDWFMFYGKDTFGCVVSPFATSSVKARVCLFADCAGAQVSCSSGTIASSPSGRPGCCVPEGGDISISLGCTGIDDSASLYIRVDQAAQDSCQSYSVSYHD